jgi:hypothetical protein
MSLNAAFAATGETFTGYYVIKNDVGRTIVPLPKGVWHKGYEEIEQQDAGSGDIISNMSFNRIYLFQLDNKNISGAISIRTNTVYGGGEGIKPANFCYYKKWKYIKQESVFSDNTFCWGARRFKFRSEPKIGSRWERVTKKIEAAGWNSPSDLRGTEAKYVRSDRDKYLSVSYIFTLSNRVPWSESRDWLEGLKPRIQAGFNGKALTLPKKAIVASGGRAGMASGVPGKITRISGAGRRVVIGGENYFNSSARTDICIKGKCNQLRGALRVGMYCKGTTSTRKRGREFKKVECNPVSQPTPTLSFKPKTKKSMGASTGDLESRLTKLKSLHDKGLVSKSQYEAKKAEMLKSF